MLTHNQKKTKKRKKTKKSKKSEREGITQKQKDRETHGKTL